jgi:hypothetical protein
MIFYPGHMLCVLSASIRALTNRSRTSVKLLALRISCS